MIVIIHATTYDKLPIHTMHIINVNGNQRLNRLRVQSGMVNRKTICIGMIAIHIIIFNQVGFAGKLSKPKTMRGKGCKICTLIKINWRVALVRGVARNCANTCKRLLLNCRLLPPRSAASSLGQVFTMFPFCCGFVCIGSASLVFFSYGSRE